uniref:Fibronectin type-III domain-containing protein n=1 Tax=Periophthalmus magnuspinnatus TaxID=409849 RepID=A0A3B4ALB8_9GOBI
QATVSWDASEGALSYTVTAEGGSGISSSCETSALSCVLADLQCGQEYSVQVVSKDDICSSLPSPATLFDSEPQRVMADMFCHNNTAMVSWEE